MNIKRYITILTATILFAYLAGCTVKYSFTGASIPVDAKTVSIPYFPNNATLVAPTLSSSLTQALQDRFIRQTKLDVISEGGDLAFEGEIVNYTSTPSSISSDEYATANRLTVTVKVIFTNTLEPQNNYTRNFSAFEDYSTSMTIQDAESAYLDAIIETLVDEIYNAAVANW